ncbi:MAG: restriction endonuclease subunit S [Bacteroidetes bacterium]|nr:MAG: restriction endonuclease subunit S [Bacteroidota bacterium]RLD84170.1 MAG: restriction endonuclease subunit S [Bacteroidota bacterium]
MKVKDKIPKLRFPEFNGIWKEKFLKKIAEKVNDKNKVNEFYNVLTNSAIQGIVNQTDYFNKEIANKNNLSGYYIVRENDFVYNPRISVSAPVGPIKRNNCETGVMSPLYTIFRFSENNLSFLEQYFATKFWHKYMYSIANYGARYDRMSITNSDFFRMKLSIPSLSEQQKTASFLTAVDDKIQQLTKKKNLLGQYKKGVMQKVFKQEIRFNDDEGNDFPEWEEKKLGDIASRITIKNKESRVVFVLTNSARKGVVSQHDYFDKAIANQNNLEGYYVVKVDDFVYNPRISSFAPVGPIKRNKLKEGVMSPLYTVFHINAENLDFFEFFFNTTGWHKYINSIANIGARYDRINITNDDFLKMPISLPCKSEQQKIADFLIATDKKIELVNTQLEKTQSFKKGLLQQMFV